MLLQREGSHERGFSNNQIINGAKVFCYCATILHYLYFSDKFFILALILFLKESGARTST